MVAVSRGLIHTEASGMARAVGGRMAPEDVAGKAFGRLLTEVPGGYAWRELRDWARLLARGGADFRGRRIFSDAGRSDCRYLARVAHRAYHARNLPEGLKAWGHLRESIKRTHLELAGGGSWQ